MLVAKLSDGRFIIGIDERNIELLTNKRPLKLDLTDYGGTDKLIVVYGKRLADVAKELEQASGQKLPVAQPVTTKPTKAS